MTKHQDSSARIFELEIWSQPGTGSNLIDGKDLAGQLLNDLKLESNVVLGLNNIPCETDSKNLRMSLSERELHDIDFRRYCSAQGLTHNIDNYESAASFLSHCYGRPLAWLHLPHNPDGLGILREILAWSSDRSLTVQDPTRPYCLLNHKSLKPLGW